MYCLPLFFSSFFLFLVHLRFIEPFPIPSHLLFPPVISSFLQSSPFPPNTLPPIPSLTPQNHILSLAESQSKSCYLEATAAGYPIYERVGFKTVEVDMRVCGVGRNWAMIREPGVGWGGGRGKGSRWKVGGVVKELK
ncbi:b0721b51-a1ac-48ca-a996-58e878d1893c-CDS [Sclerotinia trifoliorum]|uniref:B0721b51-a1ac-48ca-a996-58e878d1893c-CDS n=1 Tax=Sclerotinia trifoliorum TaxID=28548 RepID=A0A8H2ZRQ1_9HELO|nr:b0721b51-a1ac-48ca-a996-58e878d1893c-CDS [Sclerotinia trifoliorum]